MFYVKIDKEKCKGCGLCTTVCPKNLLSISKDVLNSKGFNPSQITNQEACIGCSGCATICPDVAITISKSE